MVSRARKDCEGDVTVKQTFRPLSCPFFGNEILVDNLEMQRARI